MYIVPIAWLYVAIMMAVAEANHPTGTLLGAIITFLLYGLGPVALVVYLMGAPARRRAIKAKEAAEFAQAQAASTASVAPDAGGHAAGDAITPVGEETQGVADSTPTAAAVIAVNPVNTQSSQP